MRCWATSRRRLVLSSLIPALALGAFVVTPVASAATTPLPRIDLKVLVLGTSATEPDLQAWQAALQREGVKFDTLVGPTHTPITASTLSSTLPDGTPEAKYDAIIESVGGLTDCSTGTCTSDLSSAETAALEQYEHKFNIRQITGDVFPGTTYGMNVPSVSGALDGISGTLTPDGQKAFPYLQANAPIKMDTGTYGYEATPVSTTSFDTLVGGPSGSALVGVYTHPDGVQEMVETFNQNQYQLQSELLRHGAIAWATRGVYFGDQRNYLETHIDDNFLSDDAWSTAGTADTPAHNTDFNPAGALREVPADVTHAAQWSAANHFRIDMLFNGAGSVATASGGSVVGSGDSGSGTTGSSGGTGTGGTGTDPLLSAFQSTDPATGKPYTGDFGWINHTWDHPNIDEGCATQNYIEAELNQNTNWGAAAAKAGNPVSGGLGLTSSTDPNAALGTENPNVVVTGEHSGLANLIPGNPGQVDPPALSSAAPQTSGGTLAAGEYVYAVSDQFNTAGPGATPVPGTGESAASVSAPVTVTGTTASVTLSWTAVCHAADYKIYRAPYTAGSPGTIGAWALLGTVNANTATDFTNPASSTDTTGGGPIQKTFTDTGSTAGTPATPPTSSTANESAYEQNPVLDNAFKATNGGGIKYFGADASKPYPNPADGSFATGAAPASQFTAGSTFPDAGATGIPRYPTNIYYNVATNAQEIDEYETLYDSPSTTGSVTFGRCQNIPGVTTCNAGGPAITIDQIMASVDQGMFQHMMGNDPRPHYFHQTNLMDQPGQGDGLFYETMNPLLAEYNQYFAANAPIEQPTMAQVGTLLGEQAAWRADTSVSGYIQGNQVTITNSGSGPVEAPLSGITTVGSPYGGTQSGWASVPTGTSTYTATITWPADVLAVSLSPASVVANGSMSTATATLTADGKPVAGDTVAFTSDDPGVHFGAVTDNNNGTYTVTVTSSTTVHPVTITATDAGVAPVTTGQATLNQTAGQVSGVTVSVSPGSIVANGSSTATATAHLTDTQGHPVPGEKVQFSSSDGGEKVGPVSDHGDGTYTATITSSTTAHGVTITASDISVSPAVSATTTLTQTQAPSAPASPSNPTPPSAPASPSKPSSPSGSGGPTQAQLKTLLMGLLVPSGKNARIPALLKHGGYSRSVRMPMVTHLTVNWRLPAAKGRKGTLIAQLNVTLAKGRVVTIKIALTKQGRRLLAHSKRLRLAADGTISIAGVGSVSATTSFVVSTTGR